MAVTKEPGEPAITRDQEVNKLWSAKRDKNTIVDYRLSIFDSIGDVRFDCRLPIVDL